MKEETATQDRAPIQSPIKEFMKANDLDDEW